MNNIHTVRKIFVRQLNENDCGSACLSMILNYAGQINHVQAIREHFTTPEKGLTLLQLKLLAAEFNQRSKCVEMDINHLRGMLQPCILHTVNEAGNNHFQVCFGSVLQKNERLYLMADPAHQVYFLPEGDLLKLWETRAALIFEQIAVDVISWRHTHWNSLFKITKFPKWLFISLALISISTAFFGVAITWLLQSGVNDPLSNKKRSVVIGTVILLLVISLFKSLLGYIKQQIMVTVSLRINEQLTLKFMNGIYSYNRAYRVQMNQGSIKMIISDIQKIQNAISLLLGTLVADGTLLLLCVAGVYFIMPVAALVNFIFIACSFFLTIKRLPELLYQNSTLNGLAGSYESSLIMHVQDKQPAVTNSLSDKMAPHEALHHRYIRIAKEIAGKIGRNTLLIECIGTLNIITVLSLGLVNLSNENMAYTFFMLAVILTYYASSLVTKLTGTLYAITEGSDSAVQFRSRSSE